MFSRVRVTRGMLALLTCMIMSKALAATTWYVATNGSDSVNSGTNGWADAYLTISNAIAKSVALDTVLVGPGEYFLTASLSLGSTKNIHLLGADGPTNTIINGNYPAYSIRALGMATGCVAGFTFTNAFYDVASQDGGAVYMYAGTIMTNCILTGNRARRYGGGVLVQGAVLSDCSIHDNEASYGGGVMVRDGGQILNCLIANNSCTNYGGGCYLSAGSLASNCVISGNTAGSYGGGCELNADVGGLVTDCVISGNVAVTNGGGVRVAQNCVLRNSIICDNVASSVSAGTILSGGGVYLSNTNSLMLNCLVYGNQAPNGGGGGVAMAHDADVDSCTIVSNTAGVEGGGVYTYWFASGDLRLFIRNSIVYSNDAPVGPNWSGLSTQYTWFTNCCITNTTMPQGSGLVTEYPKFVDPTVDNYRLASGSPCINMGWQQEWMNDGVDLDGRRRLDRFARQVDIGCYEFVPQGMMFQIR